MDESLIAIIFFVSIGLLLFVLWIAGLISDSKQLKSETKRNSELNEEIKALKNEIEITDRSISDLKRELTVENKTNASLMSEIKMLHTNLDKEKQDNKAKLEKIQVESTSEKRELYNRLNAEKNDLIGKINTEKNESKQKIDEIKLILSSEKRHLEQLLAEIKEEKYELQNENAVLSDEIDSLSCEIENYKEYIKNPPDCFPKMANAASDCINMHCDNLEHYFLTKPNPSLKSAEIVKQFKHDFYEAVKSKKMAEYKLEYLLGIYPALEDILDADFQEISHNVPDYKFEVDPVRDYLSKEEWSQLSESDRNQRALDNYINHNKTKWQIGRDYELYIGYVYQNKGYSVDYTGSYAKFEDLGRDLICKKDGITLIIQCKYWSKEKQIHENHINQLYGTTLAYAITNNLPIEFVKCLLITNITLSPMAKQFANLLKVEYKENCEMGDFPRIKCNVNYDEYGFKTKIYHLPMDQQYDRVQIKNKDEFFAFTVAEAEKSGFRRAFKHRG